MKVRENMGKVLSMRFAVYMSLEEFRALRDELGEVPRRRVGPNLFRLYALSHKELEKAGIENELPPFEAELLRERGLPEGPPSGRSYNSRARLERNG